MSEAAQDVAFDTGLGDGNPDIVRLLPDRHGVQPPSKHMATAMPRDFDHLAKRLVIR
jgi:hypothetical protein